MKSYARDMNLASYYVALLIDPYHVVGLTD